MNNYYVYIYLDPRKQGTYYYPDMNLSFLYEPFYVGKGKKHRWSDHLNKQVEMNRNTFKTKKINKLKRMGYDLHNYVIKIKTNLSNEEASEFESYCIRLIGRHDTKTGVLTNLTDGGEGTPNRIRSLEEKQKISDSLMGRSRISMFGEERAKEITEKCTFPRELNPFYNKHHSSDTLKRLSGENNYRAKEYIFIDPSGSIFHKKTSVKKFCAEHNLSYQLMKTSINKGKIQESGYTSRSEKSSRTVGWEIKEQYNIPV